MSWMTYYGPGIVMKVPSTWFVTSSENFQAILIAPLSKSGTHASITIAIETVQENVTPQAVAEITKSSQESNYPDYKPLDEGAMEIEGGSGYFLEYQWVDPDQNLPIFQKQCFIRGEGSLCYLTTTIKGKKTTKEDELKAIMNEIIESVKIPDGRNTDEMD